MAVFLETVENGNVPSFYSPRKLWNKKQFYFERKIDKKTILKKKKELKKVAKKSIIIITTFIDEFQGLM